MTRIAAKRMDEVIIQVQITKPGLLLDTLIEGLNAGEYEVASSREQIVDRAGAEIAYIQSIEEEPVGTAFEAFQIP